MILTRIQIIRTNNVYFGAKGPFLQKLIILENKCNCNPLDFGGKDKFIGESK